jgi:hypothetical protein|eukprot:COSAG01_NODE_6388_length_3698_cov_77.775493_7_plen_66_part_00
MKATDPASNAPPPVFRGSDDYVRDVARCAQLQVATRRPQPAGMVPRLLLLCSRRGQPQTTDHRQP